MDDFDRKILELMQADSRQTAEKIGQQVGLSPAAVHKRLKKLRDTGVISKEIAVLDPRKLNRGITAIVEVTLERENLAVLDAFKRQMREAPEVQQCYYTTGEADFILIILVQDLKEYESFTNSNFFSQSNVSKFKTAIVMDRVKVSLDVI